MEAIDWAPERDFSGSPVLWDFLCDDSLVRIIVGPVGSGKTFAICAEVMRRAFEQDPWKDNVRYTRWAFVRNTFPELKTTTIKTWNEVWPDNIEGIGDLVMSTPPQQHIKIAPTKTDPGIDCLVYFIALDTARDVKKLKSLELTGVIVNELIEIPKPIIDLSTSRLGRFPGKVKGPTTWSGVWGDTNPGDSDHYLHQWEQEAPEGYAIYRQPAAVVEVDISGDYPVSTDKWNEGEVYKHHPEDKKRPMPVIKGGDHFYVINPGAENLNNLAAAVKGADVFGPKGYYGRMIPGKDPDWIRVYLKGEDGFVMEGRPVIPHFDKSSMIDAALPILSDRPVILGMDIGGGTLTPAAVWMQRHPMGAWLVHQELFVQDMGVERFSSLLRQVHQEMFKDRPIEVAWGDPAGNKRDELYETMIFEHLRRAGIPARPAPTQEILPRINAISAPMRRLINRRPGILFHPRCKMLITGLSGRWNYRRLNIMSREVFSDKPSKNIYSHVCEALGYGLLGGGEYYAMTMRDSMSEKWAGQKEAKGFTVFSDS